MARCKRAFLLQVVALVGLSFGLTHCGSSAPPPTPTTKQLPAGLGGSNYGWYYLAPPCSREPYGVVYNYNTETATINHVRLHFRIFPTVRTFSRRPPK